MYFLTISIVLMASVAALFKAEAGQIQARDHGIIHFYEPKVTHQIASDRHDSDVAGAEAIVWWGDIERQEGVYDWSRLDHEFADWRAAGKRLDVRLATAHNSPFITPQWLYERYHVRRIGRGYWSDFETGPGSYIPGPEAQRTETAAEVVSGRASIAGTSTNAGRTVLCRLDPRLRLEAGGTFAVEFDYRTAQTVTGWVEITSQQGELTNRVPFAAVATNRASFSCKIDVPRFEDCELRFGFDGPGSLALDNINVIRLESFPPWHLTDFESPVRDWELNPGAQITRNPKQVIAGKSSVLLTGGSVGDNLGLSSHPPQLTLPQGQGFAFEFNYKALTDTSLRCQLISHDEPRTVLDNRTFNLQPGQSGRQHFYFPTFIWRDNCRMEFSVVDSGEVVIDDLQWTRWSDRVTCFPDYFDPVFQEKWARFVTRFVERYGGNPTLGTVSVGGFGRWEEAILDDDGYGGLDAQWLARGFTQEKYLAHITDCLNLYRRLLPRHPLRICLAYGLYQQNHRDWLYRRVAQAAVARGIGLKQNGLSEKWDMWDDNTSVSYLFNRYRCVPNVTLTLETGGQIARPGPGQGHPISYLNRGLIDGADFLFLYGSDIANSDVNQYLRWSTEQFGRPLTSRLYCRLGDTSLRLGKTPTPMEFRNLWLGLRQFQETGAQVIYTNRLGEKCAATSPGNPNIVFDVDDRQQYHGMSGVVLSVQYLDEGKDSFEVNALNHWTAKWQNLGVVQKSGSGQWRMASFYQPDWCRSARNSGEDVHTDLVINDRGDGAEYIANVELHFVPARQWQRSLLANLEPTDQHVLLTNTLSRGVEIPVGEPLHCVAVPIWTGSLEANAVRGRVFALTVAGETLVSDKEYVLPADGDWFELPIVPAPNCSRYRLELLAPKGLVGWYRSRDGSLAYRAWRYAEGKPAATAASTSRTLMPTNSFAAESPFFGVRVNLVTAKTNITVIARLRRELSGTGWSSVIHEQTMPLGSSSATTLWCEPQTAGSYQLELVATDSHAPGFASMGKSHVEPVLLTAREASHPPLPFDSARGRILFHPTNKDSIPWQNTNGFEVSECGPNSTTLRLTAPGAAFDVTLERPLQTDAKQVLALQLRNGTSAGLARVFWAGRGEAFEPARSVWIPLVQNDDAVREYHIAVGREPAWQGKITRLRVEPATGMTERGMLGLDLLRLLKSPATKSYIHP